MSRSTSSDRITSATAMMPSAGVKSIRLAIGGLRCVIRPIEGLLGLSLGRFCLRCLRQSSEIDHLLHLSFGSGLVFGLQLESKRGEFVILSNPYPPVG